VQLLDDICEVKEEVAVGVCDMISKEAFRDGLG
jgi:hypothetical protein